MSSTLHLRRVRQWKLNIVPKDIQAGKWIIQGNGLARPNCNVIVCLCVCVCQQGVKELNSTQLWHSLLWDRVRFHRWKWFSPMRQPFTWDASLKPRLSLCLWPTGYKQDVPTTLPTQDADHKSSLLSLPLTGYKFGYNSWNFLFEFNLQERFS